MENFDRENIDELLKIRQIHQYFPPSKFCAVQYFTYKDGYVIAYNKLFTKDLIPITFSLKSTLEMLIARSQLMQLASYGISVLFIPYMHMYLAT